MFEFFDRVTFLAMVIMKFVDEVFIMLKIQIFIAKQNSIFII